MNKDLEQLQQNLTRSLIRLDAAQTQLRPIDRPEKWSVQQIAEHLLLTYTATAAALQARLSKGTATQAKPLLRQRISQFAVTRLGYFPSGGEAPPPVTPSTESEALSGVDLIALAAQRLSILDTLTAQLRQSFGQKRAVNHMVLGPLSAHQWCRFHLVHGVHHARQILAIRKSHGL